MSLRRFHTEARHATRRTVTTTTDSPTPLALWLEQHVPLNAPQTAREELASAVTHGLGAVASVVGLVLLVARASSRENTSALIGVSVFGLSMVMLYSASCLYHALRTPFWKRISRVIDHGSIYLLIAGTYTPVMMMLGGVWGWGTFAAIWTFAAIGIALELFKMKKSKVVTILVYVAMGWSILVPWGALKAVAPPALLHWAVAGGVTYTAGTVFYAMKKLPYHHAIWHLFVLGGSACFWIGIYAHCCG